jgi:hypothetical protein
MLEVEPPPEVKKGASGTSHPFPFIEGRALQEVPFSRRHVERRRKRGEFHSPIKIGQRPRSLGPEPEIDDFARLRGTCEPTDVSEDGVMPVLESRHQERATRHASYKDNSSS